jgi:hypothetical protein
LLSQEYPSESVLAFTIAKSSGFQKLSQPATPINHNALSQALRHAWFTELLLTEKIKYPNLLPFAIPWSMVETYYAVHAGLRSYFIATGRADISTHESALQTISSDICNYKNRFPRPWNCVLSGEVNVKPLYVSNISDPITLSSPLYSPYRNDLWQHYGLFLKTTRARQIERRVSAWKKQNHVSRISKIQRQQIAQNLQATTIFNALYRIRSRANYQDIDSFTFCNASEIDFMELQSAMSQIIYHTLFVFEMMIARIVRKKVFEVTINEFVNTNLGQAASNTVVKRWSYIKTSF